MIKIIIKNKKPLSVCALFCVLNFSYGLSSVSEDYDLCLKEKSHIFCSSYVQKLYLLEDYAGVNDFLKDACKGDVQVDKATKSLACLNLGIEAIEADKTKTALFYLNQTEPMGVAVAFNLPYNKYTLIAIGLMIYTALVKNMEVFHEAEKVIRSDCNFADCYRLMSWAQAYAGKFDAALEFLELYAQVEGSEPEYFQKFKRFPELKNNKRFVRILENKSHE